MHPGWHNRTEKIAAEAQAVARCADPGIAELLPRLVPNSLLAVFRSWIARRMVYSDGGRPLEVWFIVQSCPSVEVVPVAPGATQVESEDAAKGLTLHPTTAAHVRALSDSHAHGLLSRALAVGSRFFITCRTDACLKGRGTSIDRSG